MSPRVSIVVATRNRPELVTTLIKTIEQQDLVEFECIIVDDGSNAEASAQYNEILSSYDPRFILHRKAENGGVAIARNTGIQLAQAEYIAFCDDDDYWIRTDHLSVGLSALNEGSCDLYFADMQLSNQGVIENPSWCALLIEKLKNRPRLNDDVYDLTVADVAWFLKHRHISTQTLMVRRSLFDRSGLYWDRLRFAEDQDLSFRLSDKARGIKFRSSVCAALNVSPHESLGRTHREEERCLFGMLAALHAELNVDSPSLRSVAKANRSWRMLELAKLKKNNGDHVLARDLAMQSLLVFPSAQGVKDYFSYIFPTRRPAS